MHIQRVKICEVLLQNNKHQYFFVFFLNVEQITMTQKVIITVNSQRHKKYRGSQLHIVQANG